MPNNLAEMFAHLEDAAFERLVARLSLLHQYYRLREQTGASTRKALETLAQQFNNGEAPVDMRVYAVYDKVSGRTMRRWAERLEEGGLIGLSDDYGKRSERTYASYFDPGSPLRKVAMHHLADHPDCTAAEMLSMLREQMPKAELPDLRTVQRFLTKMRD